MAKSRPPRRVSRARLLKQITTSRAAAERLREAQNLAERTGQYEAATRLRLAAHVMNQRINDLVARVD